MILIRETFVAHPGSAGKIAKMFVAAIKKYGWKNMRILTDKISDMHHVMMETEVESLAAWEDMMKNMNDAEMAEDFKDFNSMTVSGKREVFQIWE